MATAQSNSEEARARHGRCRRGWVRPRVVAPVARRAAWLVAVIVCAGAHAQSGIYTCVDSQGRRITADRPIAACIDREQRELNPSGTVRRLVGPTMTERERAVEDDRVRRASIDRARAQEEARRERALLVRYPNQQAFDADRQAALRQSDESVAFARQRVAELLRQRGDITGAAAQFTSRAVTVPAGLQQDIASNTQALEFQQAMVAAQRKDRERIDQRFDAEQIRLRELWAADAAAATAASSSR